MAEDETLQSHAGAIIAERVRPKLLGFLAREDVGLPLYSEAGRWQASPIERWSDGFWAGLFWLAWRATAEPAFREAAERLCRALAPRIDDPAANYDLGFLFFYSHVWGYRLTGEPAYRETALRAARRLCDFRCDPARLITLTYPERAARFGRPTVTTKIDVMMNLSLLWWAHAETGEPRFRETAVDHASGSLDCLLRPDGWVWELADFDPEDGALIACGKNEGVEGPSCWARAQAWAVHGFLQAAHFSGEARFLEAARRAYGYWHRKLPPDGLPFWDLLASGADRDSRDSSAAAIVLAGLLRARAWGLDVTEAEADIPTAARTLVAALTSPDEDGLLARGCAYYRRHEGRDGATVWGDYYLLEALVALAGHDVRPG